eukprot:s2613_g2.t2
MENATTRTPPPNLLAHHPSPEYIHPLRDGSRLLVPLVVQFRRGGEFHVHRAGDFLGDWEAPPLTALGPVAWLPDAEEADPPAITSGKWEMVEEGNGRVVQFYAETTGFRRDSIWIPPRKLRFRGKVYGEILSGGSAANVAIRENLFLFGVAAGIFLAFILGPVSLLALVFFSLREVSISVGTWSCERLAEQDPDTVPLAPATLKVDEPSKWL